MKDIRKIFTVAENKEVAPRTFLMRLKGDVAEESAPGQFVNIAIPGKYLRRPISIHRCLKDENELQLLYKVAGEGTELLSAIAPGEKLDILIPLGNGFSIPDQINSPLLLGGGIGAAPLMQLALDLVSAGKKPQVILGYNTAEESWGMVKELRNLGIATYIATLDGTEGTKGFVTDAIREHDIKFDYFYACGPMPMLKALKDLPQEGEMSLECRMGCGFGACVCCSIQTLQGAKRICKDGPVFKASDLIWD